MLLRLGFFSAMVISLVGCDNQKADAPAPAATESESLSVEQLCDAYWKGDTRFTGKSVNVTGHLVSYGGGIGSEIQEVMLGSDPDGNSGKWVSFKVSGDEFANIQSKQFGDLIKVEGVCVRAIKKDDSILVALRDCHFVRIEFKK